MSAEVQALLHRKLPGETTGRELTTEEVKGCQSISATSLWWFTSSGVNRPSRSDLIELIDYAADRSVFVFFDTNGLLITRDYAARLGRPLAWNSFMSASTALSRENTMSTAVWRGVSTGPFKAMKNALDAGLKCAISTYATRETLENGEFEDVIRLGRELGVTGVRYQLPTSVRQVAS